MKWPHIDALGTRIEKVQRTILIRNKNPENTHGISVNKMADFGSGTKRRYDFGGDILEATGGGQLVPVKKQKNEIEVLNEQQKSLAAVVILFN